MTLPPIGRRQGKPDLGEQDIHAHHALGSLGGMTQVPWLLGCLDAAVLDETALIVVIERLQGFCDRGIRQEDRVAPRVVVPPTPLAHHDGIDEVALAILSIRMAPVLRCPILIIGRQPGEAGDCSRLPHGPCCFCLAIGWGVDKIAVSPAASGCKCFLFTATSLRCLEGYVFGKISR
jgi:hypothetical protein